jgi:hypothetical protein
MFSVQQQGRIKQYKHVLGRNTRPACVKGTYQTFWSFVEIYESSWGFYLYFHSPTETNYSNSDAMRRNLTKYLTKPDEILDET